VYVYVYVYVCMYMCVCACVIISSSPNTCDLTGAVDVCVCAGVNVCMYVMVIVFTYICMHKRMKYKTYMHVCAPMYRQIGMHCVCVFMCASMSKINPENTDNDDDKVVVKQRGKTKQRNKKERKIDSKKPTKTTDRMNQRHE